MNKEQAGNEQLATVKERQIETPKSLVKHKFGLDRSNVKVAPEKEADSELTQDETIELFEKEIERHREQPNPQVMVDGRDLDAHLKDRWEYIATLHSGKILVRK